MSNDVETCGECCCCSVIGCLSFIFLFAGMIIFWEWLKKTDWTWFYSLMPYTTDLCIFIIPIILCFIIVVFFY